MTSDRVAAHVAAFNDAVRSGAWAEFSGRFADDAELVFEGVPAGPFRGRADIAAAYVAQPPSDTLRVLDATTDGDTDVVRFSWDEGGTGTMRLTWADGSVSRLVVSFDG